MVSRDHALVEVPAAELSPGDCLVGLDLEVTEVLEIMDGGQGRVVAISVDGDHLYFAGSSPVLSHNKVAPISASAVIIGTAITGSGVGLG